MYKKILLTIIIITICIIGVNYMNNENYKISRDINSKYLYITVNNMDTKILTVSNKNTYKITIKKGDIVKLSLLENATIVTKWQMIYDKNYIRQIDNRTIDVKTLFQIGKEGEDFTRREMILQGLMSGKTKIEFQYGDFNFYLDIIIS